MLSLHTDRRYLVLLPLLLLPDLVGEGDHGEEEADQGGQEDAAQGVQRDAVAAQIWAIFFQLFCHFRNSAGR